MEALHELIVFSVRPGLPRCVGCKPRDLCVDKARSVLKGAKLPPFSDKAELLNTWQVEERQKQEEAASKAARK